MSIFSSPAERLRTALQLHGPLSKNSTARILHNLVLALAIWLAFSTLLVLLATSPVARPNLFLVPSLLALLIVALILLRLGFLQTAGWVYLTGMLLYVNIIMVLTGGGLRNTPGLVFYASLPISAAWLFGYRATIWMTGLCLSSALVFTLMDLAGVKLHPYLPARPFAAWTFLVMAVLVAALPVAQVLRTLQDALALSQRTGHELAAELEIAQRLRDLAAQSMDASGIEALYEQILDAAMAIVHADFASIQMFYPERGTNGELQAPGSSGVHAEAAKRWEWVGPADRTTCGEALRSGRRVIVPDVRNCDFMAGSEDLDGYLGAGIRAAQTVAAGFAIRRTAGHGVHVLARASRPVRERAPRIGRSGATGRGFDRAFARRGDAARKRGEQRLGLDLQHRQRCHLPSGCRTRRAIPLRFCQRSFSEAHRTEPRNGGRQDSERGHSRAVPVDGSGKIPAGDRRKDRRALGRNV